MSWHRTLFKYVPISESFGKYLMWGHIQTATTLRRVPPFHGSAHKVLPQQNNSSAQKRKKAKFFTSLADKSTTTLVYGYWHGENPQGPFWKKKMNFNHKYKHKTYASLMSQKHIMYYLHEFRNTWPVYLATDTIKIDRSASNIYH